MKLSCPSCFANLSVDLTQIPLQGANVLCPRCNHVFFNPPQKTTALEMADNLPHAFLGSQTLPLEKQAEQTNFVAHSETFSQSSLQEALSQPESEAELRPESEDPFEEYRAPERPLALPQEERSFSKSFFFDLEPVSSESASSESASLEPLPEDTPAFQTSSTELLSVFELVPPSPTLPLALPLAQPPSSLSSSPTELIWAPSAASPPAELPQPAWGETPSPLAQTATQPKPKRARLPSLGLLLGVCLLASSAALYFFRPSFFFYSPSKPPPAQGLAPLPSLSDMQAKLQDGSRQALGEIAALPEVPSRGNLEQTLLWCRSLFGLSLLGDKPAKLQEALELMATLPKEAQNATELLKTKAAYALLAKEPANAIEMLEKLPENDGESRWLWAQAYLQQENIPKAKEVLEQASETVGPRNQKTLGDIAFSQGDYAGALEAYAKASAHPPLRAEMDLAIAKAWMKAHRPEKALEQLSAWENNPLEEAMAPNAWVLIANAQLELELYPEAALTLEKLKTHSSLFVQPMARLFVATQNPRKAAALLAEEVPKRPEDFDLAKQYAQALLLDSQQAEAENFVRQLLQRSPENVHAWLLGAAVFQQLGQLDLALAMMEKALLLEPQNVEAKLQWAAIQQKRGQFPATQSFLEKATQEFPDTAALWVALGALFQETNQLAKAKAAYAQALLKQPNTLAALIGLGRIALREKNTAELRKNVEKIEDLNPRSPEGAWLGAELLWGEGKKEEATQKLEWALKREGRHVEFWLSKAQMAMEDRHFSRADEALARARLLNPSLATVNHWSGLLYERQEDFKKAQSYFQKAAEADIHNPLYLLAQSRALMSLHRPREAVALLHRVMEQHPRNVDAPLLLGRYYQQRYRFKTALPLFEKSLAIEPDNLEALRGAADCLLELTQWTQATAMLQRLWRQMPEDAGVAQRLGRASFEAGHYAQAVRWYQKSLEKEPDNPPVLLNLGWAFKELGRKQEALEAFSSYLQLQPLAPNRRMLEDEIRFLRQRY